ncbi:O-antigen ligase family protein [Patescibacteria group bacterium]|nr:MAG: O-antigen ligase family protein [Patescibacteria group bacterium]
MKKYTLLGSPQTFAEWILCVLTCAILLTPLLFFPDYFSPFTNAKLMGFLLLVEITFPVYLFVRFSRSNRPVLHRNPIIILLLILMLAMSISALFGADPFNSFFGNASRPTGVFFYLHLSVFFFYLIEILSLDQKWKSRLIHLVTAFAGVAALYGLLESWLLPAFVKIDGRVGSIFGNPSVFASFLLLPLFFSLGCFQESRRPKIFLFLASSLIIVSAIFLTGTRSALVGLLAGALFWISLRAHHAHLPRKSLALWFITFVVLFAGMFFAVRTMVPTDHALYRLTDFSDTNTQARFTYWKLALMGWLDHPFLGVGSENFYTIADQYGDPSATIFTSVWPDKSHSAFIGRLLATGLVGIVVYLCLLFFVARKLFTSKQPAHTLWLAGLIAYLVHGFFLFETVSGLIIFFFLLALCANEGISTSQPLRPSKNKLHRILVTGMGALTTLVLVLGFTYPMHQLILNIGKGNRILQEDARVAITYYQSTESLPFIWDTRLVARTYADAFMQQLQTPVPQKEIVDSLFRKTQVAFDVTLVRHPLQAQDWNGLANISLQQAIWEDSAVSIQGVQAVERAIELAPFNPLPQQTLSQIYAHNIAIYVAHEQYSELVAVYELLVANNPNELPLLANLAAAYAKAGQREKAIETANLLKERDPASAPAVEAFLENL